MATIPIRDVPGEAVQPSGNELILIDNGIAMQKATINDAVTPKASEIADQKIADLNLGTAAQANVEDFATAAQGDLADSAVQPGDLAAVATSGDYNDLANLPTLGTAAEADVGDFAPAAQAVPTGGLAGQVLVKETNDDNDVGWATVAAATAVSYGPQDLTQTQRLQALQNIRNPFETVSDLLTDSAMGYVGGGADVVVSPGDIIEAEGFRYEIEDAEESTTLETAGGIKINLLSHIWRPAAYGIFSSSLDQLAALREFVRDAADKGATIEWGAIDLSIDPDLVIDDERGLVVPSGSHWVMHPNFNLRSLPSAEQNYELLKIHDKTDIVIEGMGGRIWGERDQHLGVGGEWGMGVSIRGSTRVKVFDLLVRDCWGDGFYVGATASQKFSAEIELIRVKGDNNRRQGLSLISARSLLVEDGVFENTNGTAPQYGIDIEPNNSDEFLEDIHIVRPITRNNAGAGIGLAPRLAGGSPNRVSVTIDDPVDDGSLYGFSANYMSDLTLDGRVVVNNMVSRNAGLSGISFRTYTIDAPPVVFNRPVIEDWNRDASPSDTYSAGILILGESHDLGTRPMGNVSIRNPELKLNSGSATSSVMVQDNRPGAEPWERIEVLDPLSLADRTMNLSFPSGSTIKVSDRLERSKVTLAAASENIQRSNFACHYVVPALAGAVTKDITETLPIGSDMEFVLSGGATCNIRFPVGTTLTPVNVGANRVIAASAKGSRLRIRKVAATEWAVISSVGDWTPS